MVSMFTRAKSKIGCVDDHTHDGQSNRSGEGATASKDKDEVGSDVDDKETSMDAQSTRSHRGRTFMDRLSVQRAQGVKKDISFNHLGQPIGKDGSEMQSYIGVLTREKVNINYKTWKQVPNDIKELIWESVNMVYNVHSGWKNNCLKSSNDKWRQYKTHLTQDIIFKNQNDPEKLNKTSVGYGISQEDWSAFVISRMSKDFQQQSEELKNRRKKNMYPHLLSRKGYSGLAEEIADELGDDIEINRAILWKRARMNKDGEFEGKELQDKVKAIDEYIEKRREGKLQLKGIQDGIIPKALQSKENAGRVRGIGGHVTPTMYLNFSNSKKDVGGHIVKEYKKELFEAKRKINDQDARIAQLEVERETWKDQDARIALLEVELKKREVQDARIAQIEAEIYKRHVASPDIDEKGSCSVKFPTFGNQPKAKEDLDDFEIIEDDEHLQGKLVALALKSSTDVVAYGTIISVNVEQLHNATVPKGCMRVSIDDAVNESAPLPIPIPNECETVGDALGTHVAWPKELILLHNEKHAKKKSVKLKKKNESNAPKSLHMLYRYGGHALQGLDNTIAIPLDSDVFGEDHTTYVHLEDITHVYELSPVSCTCIVVYVWQLCRKLKGQNKLDRFLFMNPHLLPHIQVNSQGEDKKTELMEKRARVLAIRLCHAKPNQLVLVPCNIGEHWILTMIDPHKEIVYILDSLGPRIRDLDWKHIVNMVITFFNVSKQKRGKKNPMWELLKGPRQPDALQCGYYVMRSMREITEKVKTFDQASLRSIFTQKEYTEEEIDEVRSEWANCVQDYI